MGPIVVGKELTCWEVSADGADARLGLSDQSGQSFSLRLPEECIAALLMTLPSIMEQMIRRRYPDPAARLVFPTKDWRVDLAHDRASLILTLATQDGFSVSFFLSPESSRELGEVLAGDRSSVDPLICAKLN